MTELEARLSQALQQLAQQYEREQTRQAAQIADLQQQVQSLISQLQQQPAQIASLEKQVQELTSQLQQQVQSLSKHLADERKEQAMQLVALLRQVKRLDEFTKEFVG